MTTKTTVRVADVMTEGVKSIHGMKTVLDAIHMMRDEQVNSLVVERRDADDEVGMIVVSDIAKEVISSDRAPERINVYEIMSKPVLSVPADMNIRYAARLLVQFGLSRALVIDVARAPIGLVTLKDMVIRSVTEDEKAHRH